MKLFIKNSVKFVLPIILLLVILEIIVGTIPNSYSYKYNYVRKNGKKIQAIAIGHSQLYDGFKPESFYLPSFNLCNSGQGYLDNFYLLGELLSYMPNLKMVIMPIGYINVGKTEDSIEDMELTDRSCYYHKYMKIDYDGHVPLKYLFECFDPFRSVKKIFSYYVFHSDIVGCDSMGRRSTHYLKNRKHVLGYENLFKLYTCKEHNRVEMCIKEESYLEKTFDMLMKKKIQVVLVSPPYYWNCGYGIVNKEQKMFAKNRITELRKRYHFQYIDLESDTTFTYDDFFDETHLSELGAEKFTHMLSKKAKSNQYVN